MGLFGNRKNKETKISGAGSADGIRSGDVNPDSANAMYGNSDNINMGKNNNVIAIGADGDELLAVLGAAISASSSFEHSDEHIAVIASAIAAYEDADVHTDLCIRKIDRTVKTIPAWGAMGNREQIDSRRW